MIANDKVNILLVDDQPGRLVSYEAILSDLGQNLVKAQSGAEALQLLMKQDIAVVLLDVSMPGMDGFETATLIHEHPRFEKTPIIFVTGVAITDLDRLKGYALGAVDYIYVPVVPQILRSKVAVFVELYRQRRELKLLNAELAKRAEQLARSNTELEQFAYVASHDLREPLRMVQSFCGLLKDRYGGKLDERADKYIDFAVDGAARMQRLVDALLEYSRVGRGNEPFQAVPLDEVLRQALANVRVAVAESGANVEVVDPLPTVHGDATRLCQVFQNLISNAIKFRRGEPPVIKITACRDGDGWRITVSDNGIGIDPQHFHRLFVIYQRLHTTDEYPGTGIGLALCKRIVELHGGRIWLESQPGRGTSIHFRLLAAKAPTLPPEQEGAECVLQTTTI